MSIPIVHDPHPANMTDDPPTDLPTAEVGRDERHSQAKESALVVSAMASPHWIECLPDALPGGITAARSPSHLFRAHSAGTAGLFAPLGLMSCPITSLSAGGSPLTSIAILDHTPAFSSARFVLATR